MKPRRWDADTLDRFVRYLRLPRAELEHLEDRLRRAGWTDAEVESLTLANTELGQVQQQNDVTSEFLEKAWPEMASGVANGAAEGLADLIERAPVKQ